MSIYLTPYSSTFTPHLRRADLSQIQFIRMRMLERAWSCFSVGERQFLSPWRWWKRELIFFGFFWTQPGCIDTLLCLHAVSSKALYSWRGSSSLQYENNNSIGEELSFSFHVFAASDSAESWTIIRAIML